MMKPAIILLLVLLLAYYNTTAKEIIATNEWTLLGENDTIAAGMHVRMDLTTGEKWVRLPQQEDAIASSSSEVELSSHSEEIRVEPEYDFDMMHRALSKLPPEEQQRIGLPPLPESSEQQLHFEETMTRIWKQRQSELKAWEHDFLADLPKLIKERIAAIRQYLEQPYQQLQTLDLQQVNPNDDTVNNIVDVLLDLEFQLSDLDMARDFYTLGGWPVLVSLLSDKVHQQGNHTINIHLQDKIHAIQTHAAWAMGTVVKNTGEFNPFAVQEIEIGTTTTTTALDLLTEQLQNTTPSESQTLQEKMHKLLYALGAFLRGNRWAQVHWSASSGPERMAEKLDTWLQDGSKPYIKMSQRVLTLAHDVVTDVQLHRSKTEQSDQAIVAAFSSSLWCDCAARALQIQPLAETALHTVITLAPHCTWKESSIIKSIQQIEDTWKNDESIDQDILASHMNLIERARTSLA